MSFQSLTFLGFFIIIAPICLLVGRKKPAWGIVTLALCSLYAYTGQGLGVLLLGIWITFGVSHILGKDTPHRRGWLGLGVCYHVAVLVAFKYVGFFTAGALSLDWAPVGISFFTFSQIWYLKAVYDRGIAPVSFEKLGLYGLFFPTVVSGPILSPAFFPQLEEEGFLRPNGQQVLSGLYCFGCGLVKKVLLADQLALLVAAGYGTPWGLSIPAAWLVVLGFTLQLYLDFSGYCDMAVGVARMLGIRLPVNFNSPYRAVSIGDFWKRWHITLTSFFRQCVYLPLGGNRKGTLRTYGHIVLIFLISGLWHGAGWTFILWGLCHGLAQVVERLLGHRIQLPKVIGWCGTFLFVNLAWVLFRAPNLSDARGVLFGLIGKGYGAIGARTLAGTLFPTEITALETLLPQYGSQFSLLAMGGLFVASLTVAFWKRNTVSQLDALQPKWYQMVGLGLLVGWCMLSFGGDTTFIYANF